jgi:hypothetical protein
MAIPTEAEQYNHHGLNGNSMILSGILGHEPRTLKEFISEFSTHRSDKEFQSIRIG